ncbi:MAG: hypothetical protein LKJ86_00465 [Oscillibacter sp.]|nr:hypothetical protein [Oscillibacter sp.]
MKNIDLTPALLEQAKTAPSAAALLALAKENGVELTAEEAAYFFVSLHPETGKLSDEELDSAAGGGGFQYYDGLKKSCPKCHNAHMRLCTDPANPLTNTWLICDACGHKQRPT